ncbi:MAG: FecR domain-containing protein, partial [Planctomycetota bacterium]
MSGSKDDLNAKFVAGDADDDEINRLNRSLAGDPTAVEALMSEAYFAVHLRETLSESAVSAELATQPPAPSSSRSWRTAAAACLVVAVSGWTVVAYVLHELEEERATSNALSLRVAELEREAAPTTPPEIPGVAPRIHGLRGFLWPAQRGAQPTPAFRVGENAPLEQRLWTCPWGATEFRYGSGVSITAERNSAVTFNTAQKGRRLTLELGTLHATNVSRTDRLPTEIRCPRATVRLLKGQVAIQVTQMHTMVEVALGKVRVEVMEGERERSITVRAGHYLIVRSGETARVKKGTLSLELTPPNE